MTIDVHEIRSVRTPWRLVDVRPVEDQVDLRRPWNHDHEAPGVAQSVPLLRDGTERFDQLRELSHDGVEVVGLYEEVPIGVIGGSPVGAGTGQNDLPNGRVPFDGSDHALA